MGFLAVCGLLIIDILLLTAAALTGVAFGLAINKIRKKRKAAREGATSKNNGEDFG